MVKLWSVDLVYNSIFEGLKFGAILGRPCAGGRGRSAPQGRTIRGQQRRTVRASQADSPPLLFSAELHIIGYTFDQCG